MMLRGFILVVSSLAIRTIDCGCVVNMTIALCRPVEKFSDIPLVGVTKLRITNDHRDLPLPINAFSNITGMKLLDVSQTRTSKIYPDTFNNVSLEGLWFTLNELQEIYPDAFKNLPKLKVMSITFNKLTRISRGVFRDLPISSLALSNNLIETIEDDSLDLARLITLHLQNNRIGSISPHKILSAPQNLEYLSLQHNFLQNITGDTLANLSNLLNLNLAYKLITTLEPGCFRSTPRLASLVLTHNRLKRFDEETFPVGDLARLQRLYLDGNYLMYLPSEILDRLPELRGITLVTNPWLCKCLDSLAKVMRGKGVVEKCNEMYTDGKLAVCIDDGEDGGCKYRYNEELSMRYVGQRDEAIYLSPRCKL